MISLRVLSFLVSLQGLAMPMCSEGMKKEEKEPVPIISWLLWWCFSCKLMLLLWLLLTDRWCLLCLASKEVHVKVLQRCYCTALCLMWETQLSLTSPNPPRSLCSKVSWVEYQKDASSPLSIYGGSVSVLTMGVHKNGCLVSLGENGLFQDHNFSNCPPSVQIGEGTC